MLRTGSADSLRLTSVCGAVPLGPSGSRVPAPSLSRTRGRTEDRVRIPRSARPPGAVVDLGPDHDSRLAAAKAPRRGVTEFTLRLPHHTQFCVRPVYSDRTPSGPMVCSLASMKRAPLSPPIPGTGHPRPQHSSMQSRSDFPIRSPDAHLHTHRASPGNYHGSGSSNPSAVIGSFRNPRTSMW